MVGTYFFQILKNLKKGGYKTNTVLPEGIIIGILLDPLPQVTCNLFQNDIYIYIFGIFFKFLVQQHINKNQGHLLCITKSFTK